MSIELLKVVSQSLELSLKSISQSTQNALKRIEMQKKMFAPLTHYKHSAMKI